MQGKNQACFARVYYTAGSASSVSFQQKRIKILCKFSGILVFLRYQASIWARHAQRSKGDHGCKICNLDDAHVHSPHNQCWCGEDAIMPAKPLTNIRQMR